MIPKTCHCLHVVGCHNPGNHFHLQGTGYQVGWLTGEGASEALMPGLSFSLQRPPNNVLCRICPLRGCVTTVHGRPFCFSLSPYRASPGASLPR